jgi:hypothetical protein
MSGYQFAVRWTRVDDDAPSWKSKYQDALHHSATFYILRQLFVLTVTTNLVVFFVYWAALAPHMNPSKRRPDDLALSIIEHLLNLAFILVDLFLTSTQPRFFWDSVTPVFFAFLYTLYAWMGRYALDWPWPYPFFDWFLDPCKPFWVTTLGLIGGSLLIVACFVLMMGCVSLRNKWARRARRRKQASQVSIGPQDKPSSSTDKKQWTSSQTLYFSHQSSSASSQEELLHNGMTSTNQDSSLESVRVQNP